MIACDGDVRKTRSKAHGRSRADFEPLLPGEEELIQFARRGEWWTASASAPEIRGEFLRFLVLGGDNDTPVHEKGPRLRGARVTSDLEFTGCRDMRVFALEDCYIEGDLLLEVAKTASIYLDGCTIKRVKGNRAEINGSIYLRFGFVAREGLDLSGSHVTGSVSCRGATFRAGPKEKDEPVSYCFRMDDAEIDGTLILGARHRGDLDGENAQRNATSLCGMVSLQGTHCAALFDQAGTYAQVERGQLRIHGFRYGRLAGVDAAELEFRLRWLRKSQKDGDFTSPQTYEYLAHVLREMGHDDAARTILIERQRLERHVIRRRQADTARQWRDKPNLGESSFESSRVYRFLRWMLGTPKRFSSRVWNYVFYALVRYGYEPWRAIAWSGVPLLVGVMLFSQAYRNGDMIPADASIANGKAWRKCKVSHFPRPSAALPGIVFVGESPCPASKELPEYPRFNALWYSFDTFVPIISVHQAANWTLSPEAPLTREYLSIHIVLGWLFVTLGLANMLGMLQRRAAPGGK